MKAFVFVATTFLFFQCQEGSENRSLTRSIYHRGIGSSIPITVAEEWMSNCVEKQSSSDQRSKEVLRHTLTPAMLADAISVSQNVIGATFQNAIDSDGVSHILFIPFIEGLPFRNDVSPIIDMTTSSTLNRITATAWTSAYMEANPNSIRYYFFGRDVLDEILNTSSLTALEAAQGLTNDGEYKLVLLAHQNESNAGGRLNATDPVAYDNSCPCPNTCAE